MNKIKFYTFVFTLLCTALLINLLISYFLFFSEGQTMTQSDFKELLLKDFILSGVVVLVLVLMLRKKLMATFSKNK